MEKTLIISYFFPPSKFTASSRIDSWRNYLNEFGYKPFIITRNWDSEPNNYRGLSSDSGINDYEIKKDNQEIYYLKFKGTLRDKLFSRFGENKFILIRKFLSLVEQVFQNFYLYHPIYKQLFFKAEELIIKEKITKIIISANPFVQFQIGYKLKKKHPQIEWIADYRDDWNTTELITNRSFISRLLHKLESKSEKKWLSSSHSFVTISSFYVKKISSFINVKGNVILNGINDDVIPVNTIFNKAEYIITYNGTLYNTQPIEPFLEALNVIVDHYRNSIFVKINFIGLAIDETQVARVKSKTKKITKNVLITKRVSKKEVIKFQNESNLLLMLSHKNLKGISSSKLYEYIGLHKKVLLYPNDNDIIEETLLDTQLGIITNTKIEIINELKKEIDSFIKFPDRKNLINMKKINAYSRKHQTKKLAEILDSI